MKKRIEKTKLQYRQKWQGRDNKNLFPFFFIYFWHFISSQNLAEPRWSLEVCNYETPFYLCFRTPDMLTWQSCQSAPPPTAYGYGFIPHLSLPIPLSLSL